MDSIRKWFYRPKKDDTSLLAQFFYADEALNIIANELDSFDGRKDPERCTTLVNQLRQSQDKVLTITNSIMDVLIGDERADRDFRVKFPEDVLQENLAGQLWFGAECLAAGSSIMNREQESTMMRPLAKAVTKSLEHVRNLLRQACLRNNTPNGPLKLDNNELITEMLIESLKIFDKFFAEFELAYVSAMVPVKTTHEYELQEMIGVLFSETLQKALRGKLLTQEMVDSCDPALMFTIPRLAIVHGLLAPNGEPLYVDRPSEEMSEMFRPFRTLLHRIRELLWTLNKRELYHLERLLCDNEDINDVKPGAEMTFDEDSCIVLDDKRRLLSDEGRANEENEPSTSSLVGGYRTSSDDRESLKVISVAAATLSSILTNNNDEKGDNKDDDKAVDADIKKRDSGRDLESPNDSGISTETASLDRSPTYDGAEKKRCCCCSDEDGGGRGGCACVGMPRSNGISEKKNKKDLCTKEGGGGGGGVSRRTLGARKKRNGVLGRQQDKRNSSDCSSDEEESSDTSSFNSASVDQEEVAMAMQAAAVATRNEIRAKYRSGEDLLHRLFVCVAGVADQLQTNFASDLRNILKSVFLINTSDANEIETTSSTTSTLIDLAPNNANTCLETSTHSSIEYRPPPDDVTESTTEFSVDPNILAQEALFDTNVYFHIDDGVDDETLMGSYTNHPRHHRAVAMMEEIGDDMENYVNYHQHGRRDNCPDRDAAASLREGLRALTMRNENGDASGADNAVVVGGGTTTTTATTNTSATVAVESPPVWIPDVEASKCMSCGANFTVVKRRHHCRNCGKIFCGRCSSNNVPLPKYGHTKPVRVCNKCFVYNLAPFGGVCERGYESGT